MKNLRNFKLRRQNIKFKKLNLNLQFIKFLAKFIESRLESTKIKIQKQRFNPSFRSAHKS